MLASVQLGDHHIIIAYQCDGVFVLVHLVPGCGVGDVDRREVVQVSAKFLCPSMGLLRISVLFTPLSPDFQLCPYHVSVLLFWHPLLSNDLVATEFRHASCPLTDVFEQDSEVLSKLGILL